MTVTPIPESEEPLRRSLPAPTPGIVLPMVYRPQGDSKLLIEMIAEYGGITSQSRVLDLCTGSGAAALAAARRGPATVTAVDVSWPAAITTRLNARLSGLPVTVHRGSLCGPVSGQRFDLITANPPYVPAPPTAPPPRGRARCWDAGVDGRTVLDRICEEAPRLLFPGGRILLVHSALSKPEATVARLARNGLYAAVVAEAHQPFGPVLRSRAEFLEQCGLIARGERTERLVAVLGMLQPDDCSGCLP